MARHLVNATHVRFGREPSRSRHLNFKGAPAKRRNFSSNREGECLERREHIVASSATFRDRNRLRGRRVALVEGVSFPAFKNGQRRGLSSNTTLARSEVASID